MKGSAFAFLLIVSLCTLSAVPTPAQHSTSPMHLLTQRATWIAMEDLPFDKGDPNLLVLTNAGRVITVGDQSTAECIDALTLATGTSIGRNNLIPIRSTNEPLWFLFYRKDTADCVYIVVNGSAASECRTLWELDRVSDESLFKISKHNVDAGKLFESPLLWGAIEEDLGEADAFSVVALTNALSGDIPSSLVACLQSHREPAPELISGYVLAEYLRQELPVETPRDQEYITISLAGSMRDDAIITLLDATPGRSGLFIKQNAQLQSPVKNASVIFVLWNGRTKRGDGLVLAVDDEKVAQLAGADMGDVPERLRRLKIILWGIEHLDDPELFISTVQTFRINERQLDRLTSSGPDSLAVLDELPRAILYRPTSEYVDMTSRDVPPSNINIAIGVEPEKDSRITSLLRSFGLWGEDEIEEERWNMTLVSNTTGEENPTIQNLLAFRASDIAMEHLNFEKNDPHVLAFTDAGYVVNIGGYSTETCIDTITATTGCTVGKNNLLLVHRSADMPLWFMFSRTDTKDFIYFSVRDQKLKAYLDVEQKSGYNVAAISDFMDEPADALFKTIVKHNVGIDALAANPASWDRIASDISTINAMGIATTTNVLAHDVPPSLASCAELHTRICPGTVAGYLISEHVGKDLPLRNQHERYIVLPMSFACKDDAVITLLGTNSWELFTRDVAWVQEEALLPADKPLPGKSLLRNMNFTDEQIDLILSEDANEYNATVAIGFSTVVGLFIRWNEATETGDGVVVTIDMKEINDLSGVNYSPGPWWLWKLPADSDISRTPFADRDDPDWKWKVEKSTWMAEHLDELGRYVKSVKRFKLNSTEELIRLESDDVDPLVAVGVLVPANWSR